jgi:hypothetical protein
MCCHKRDKELRLGDMVDGSLNEQIDFITVRFRGEYNATSNGWSKWDECASIQTVIILLFLQYSLNSANKWLSCPSIINIR